ncbi:MAG: ABC transporter permease subunit [Oscillospiraceae bacterium]|nr:ABC transporter permease subunit [Oscillospiraceae bacterium]
MFRNKIKGFLFSLLSFTVIIAVWWALAETKFKQTGIIPPPLYTLQIIGEEMRKDSFFKAVLSTLERSFVSFFISFAAAGFLAVLVQFKGFIGNILNPFILLCRSMPTMALILILLLTVGSDTLPVVVSFLVVFPLCYENMRAAVTETDKNLIIMAKVFKVPKHRQITGIYIPAMLPFVFSSVTAGFGLNIKVVISAEVMGLPAMSIGHLILSARQGFNFGVSFAWLVIAVILSLICESIIRLTGRFCMPYKYPDAKIIKNFVKRIFTGKKMGETENDKL